MFSDPFMFSDQMLRCRFARPKQQPEYKTKYWKQEDNNDPDNFFPGWCVALNGFDNSPDICNEKYQPADATNF